MSFVCTRMSSTCHSYVLVYHPYVILATTLIPVLFIRIFLSSTTRFGNLNNLKGAHITSCSHVQRSAWANFFQVPNLSSGHFYLRPRWDTQKMGAQNKTTRPIKTQLEITHLVLLTQIALTAFIFIVFPLKSFAMSRSLQ